jgi:hypothetical protein
LCPRLSMSLCLPKGSAKERGSRHAIQTHERTGELEGDEINSHTRRTPSMKVTWRRHLIICLFLGLLAIPIYFLDEATLRPSGGNWISLDFRGLIIWTYIILLAIHVTLSSIGVLFFPGSGALRIQLGSMVLSVILLVTGFVIYGKLVRLQLMHAYEIRMRTDKRSDYRNLLC